MKNENKLDYKNFSLLTGYLGILIGLVLGIIYSFGGLLIDTLVTLDIVQTQETPGLSIGTIYAFLALLGMPLIGGVSGIILGFLSSFLYNCLPIHFIHTKFDIYKKKNKKS